MQVQIKDNYGVRMVECPTDESGFYKKVAETISQLEYPNTVTVSVAGKSIEYNLEERGGTCNIQETHSNLEFKIHSEYPKVFLTYADFESAEKKAKEARGQVKLGGDYGSYKFYSLESENGEIKASWGSMRGIGLKKSCTYKNSMYWIKYYEKINKGYNDNTEAYVEPASTKETTSVKLPGLRLPESERKVNSLSQRLYNLLSNSSIQLIKRSVRTMVVTQGMINKSKEILSKLYNVSDLEAFNKLLLELFQVSPRKCWDMKQLMAKSVNEIPRILEREEDLVDAMQGLLLKQQSTDIEKTAPSNEKPDPFAELGITVSNADEEARKMVMKMLPSDLQCKVNQIYKVDCEEHAKRFDVYCKQNNIKNTKFLWHGSRNENWLSIIRMGLMLKPNAKITGKMFGNGIYFAPKAKKSWGYTSGGYWTKEAVQHFAMMGVYETAYGEAYHPVRNENWQFTQLFLKQKNKNCVHAEGGTCGLMNDEIIFYDEAAMCLRYVVEFA